MEVNGTLIWYYTICKRQVWLISHSIISDQKNENLLLGKYIHEEYYSRDKKEIKFGDVVFDVINKTGETLIIGEIKKSSKTEDTSILQLQYYLLKLKRQGIEARGVLMIPTERKRKEVELNENIIEKLCEMEKAIIKITYLEKPPIQEKNNYCRNCSYSEMCWS